MPSLARNRNLTAGFGRDDAPLHEAVYLVAQGCLEPLRHKARTFLVNEHRALAHGLVELHSGFDDGRLGPGVRYNFYKRHLQQKSASPDLHGGVPKGAIPGVVD